MSDWTFLTLEKHSQIIYPENRRGFDPVLCLTSSLWSEMSIKNWIFWPIFAFRWLYIFMRDGLDPKTPPILRQNYLRVFKNYLKLPFIHPFFRTAGKAGVIYRKWLIIYGPMTSSDMTSQSNRTLELKRLDPNYRAAKLHGDRITSFESGDDSFRPILATQNWKIEKIAEIRNSTLRILPLRVEPKVTFNNYLGYSKNSSGRSEPSSLYVIRILVNKKSY